MAYTDVQKATACELIRQNNGVIDEIMLGVLRDTLEEPKLPKMTAWRWWKQYQQLGTAPAPEPDVTDKNKPIVTSNIIDVTAVKLDEKLELAAHKFINHAVRDELIMWTSSKDAMTAAAIAIDKMRLLRDLPTEIVKVLPVVAKLNEALSADGIGLGDALEVWLNEYLAEKAKVEGQPK